ncbi:unnamed protein product [Paramecium sonneborni]|uniref:Dynein light chain n=1 Tax=Paramecium sonneborni TaxID=65129 RepID=A0A8S1P4C3_9CILI|nr:unnamed protein product [Paramecium sonneborni]
MSSQATAQYRMYLGARVLWPPDCPDDILEGAINETQNCLKTYEAKDGQKMAEQLKKYLDSNFEPYWHVFFGKNFGCHSIHEKRRFIYFYIDKTAYLFYKTQ